MGSNTFGHPRVILFAGATLLATIVVLTLFVHPGPASTPAPSRVAMSWSNAGAFVVNTHDVDPTWLGLQMRTAGFGWVAIYLGSTGRAYPIDRGWAARFVQASGLPVGGWSVLAGYPHSDAGFAATQLKKNGLSFYIADAEAEYVGKPGASQKFVTAFRKREPTIAAGLSSLCDATGIGLRPWAPAGFAFLPQAYVNDFGSSVSPAVCVRKATGYFAVSAIHPTVGSYRGMLGYVPVSQWAQLLAKAGTVGFSVYTAETEMTADDWQAYGLAIRTMHIAAGVS
jgi:hypothetical protein